MQIDLECDSHAYSGADINVVRDDIQANLAKYFASIAFVDSIVRYTQIGNALLDVDAVLDYSDLTVNGAVANVQLSDDEVPVVGSILIN